MPLQALTWIASQPQLTQAAPGASYRDKMGQDTSDRAEPPGPAPEPFDDFYLREYPAVVGLLQGLPPPAGQGATVGGAGGGRHHQARRRPRGGLAGRPGPGAQPGTGDRPALLRGLQHQPDRRHPGPGARHHQGPAPPGPPPARAAPRHRVRPRAAGMSSDDRPRTADRTLEERLRAAGSALREAAAAQVDAAIGLREIVHSARSAGGDQVPSPADRPVRPAADGAPPLGRPRTRLLRASQRLALVVNLLLVVALSVVLIRVAGNRREPVSTAPPVTATTIVQPATVPPGTFPAKPQVPEECLEAAELADQVIARLNRNQRDNALALDLWDYAVASQACRREAGR